MADHEAHAAAFVGVLRELIAGVGGTGSVAPSRRFDLADIGSGAGVPGLLVAEALPEVSVTLIERREGRASWLEEAAAALADEGIGVRVVCADVYDVAHGEGRGGYDLVTARAFGPPVVTAELGGALLGVGGRLVVSEPPDRPDRWQAVDLSGLGLEDAGPAGGPGVAAGPVPRPAHFRVLIRRSALGAARPRRRPRG